MAGSFGYNPGQFGSIAARPAPYDRPSGFVTDRQTYFTGPSDSTRVHAHTAQVAPYMAESSGYNPERFGLIAERLALTTDGPSTKLPRRHHIWPNSLDIPLAQSWTIRSLTPVHSGMRTSNQGLHNFYTHRSNTMLPLLVAY
jgi:hypothetical protein